MIREVEGSTDGTGLHIGLAAARWNQSITDRLLAGALARCQEIGVDQVTVMRVPGALELPLAVRELARSGCDAVVAIATVIKGETDHYEVVVGESARGVGRAALETGVPIANAILAVHEYAHAVERAGPGKSNKGTEGVDAAVMTVTALRELRGT